MLALAGGYEFLHSRSTEGRTRLELMFRKSHTKRWNLAAKLRAWSRRKIVMQMNKKLVESPFQLIRIVCLLVFHLDIAFLAISDYGLQQTRSQSP